MKNKKKLISLYSMIVGTLLVVAGLFSFGVYAALNFNATTNGILNYTDKVCYIKGETDSDNVYYPSLNSALASVTDGGTICVFKTVSMSADITITKNVTIQGVYQDSNINMGANSIIVNQGKTLNLGGGDKILTVVGSKYSADSGVIVNKGTLNLNLKSKIENNQTNEPDENCAIGVYNSGSLSVSGSIINTVHGYAIFDIGNLGVNISNSSTNITGLVAIGMASSTQKLNITGGTIKGGMYGILSYTLSDNVTPKVDMVISGNPVISGSGYGILVNGCEGKLEIKGSPKISASSSKDNMVVAVGIVNSNNKNTLLNISGGTFNAEKLDSNPNVNVFSVYEVFSEQSAETFNISGGTFNAPVGLSVISSNVPATTPNTISGGTFNKGIVVNALGVNITGGKFIAGPNNAAIDGEYSNIAINTGSIVGSVNLNNSSKLTLKGSPLIEKIISTKLGTTEDSAMIFIEDSYAPTTKAKIEFPLNGSCNYIAKYTGSKNANASIFDSQIISASGKYLKTRGFTTTVVDNGGSLKGNIKTYYPSMSEQSFAIGSNTKTGSTLTGYTVAWADTTHSTTLPTATTSSMSIPANAYGNISLTPTWSSHTYTIKYNGNGATGGSTANSTHTYGVAKALTANGYTKTGYTFAGWATSANGAVVYQDKQSVTSLTAENGATITLYAKWTANKYKVRYYDTYANTTTYTEVEYTYDNNTLKFPNGSLDNFTFVGWVNSATNLSPDGAYKYNTAVSNLSATNNAIINVYSLYSRNVIVSYNGDGATSGSTASETKTQYYNKPGSKATSPEFTVAANGFTKTGYAFTNWTNGSTTYAPGAKITPFTDQNVVTPFTLKAQWSQNHSTIKLGTMTNVTKVEYKEGENGTYEPLTTNGFAANSNTDYYFRATLATASGYTITFTNFTGWFTDTANPSSAHNFTAGGQTYIVNAVASKVQNTATIKRGDITNVTKVYYSTNKTNWVELTTQGFTANSNTNYYFKADLTIATGYTVTFKTFGGWFTDTANPSSEHSFTEKGTYTVTATADKKINTYSIAYELAGGTVATANPTSYTVETATFTLHNPTKTGYTFTGWTGSNGSTAQTTVTIAKGTTGDKSYTANWSINKFTVNIVSNNTAYGTVDVAKVDNVPYGSKVTVSGNTITVNGTKVTATATANTAQYTYAFSSWSIANNATITGATTITATFTQTVNKYTVTIAVNNSNYGSVDITSVANVPYGTKLSASSNVLTVLSDKKVTATAKTLAGYNTVFSSWTNGTATVQGNLTVTANFTRTAISYTISYDLKGGSVATANPTTYTIETATFTLHNPTRQGYTFAGWTGTGLSSASTSVSIAKGSTGNRTYTATWTPNTNTAYKVEHYQEGLDGKYVLKDTENKTGTTATTVTGVAKSYTGFTYDSKVAGTVASGTIAANGSLVLKLYYTRNSYKVTLTKGTGVSAVTGSGTYKYGASVSIDATVSSGYTWSKWTQTTGGAQVSTTKAYTFTMPANDVSYTATTTVNGYTVTYDAKTNGGSTANQTKTVAYGASVDLSLTATKDGWTFVGWNTDKSAKAKLNSYTMPANNVILYAIYSKELTGEFKYYNNQTQNVTVTIYNTATSGSITAPAALGTPSGYTFRHWSTSNTANAASTVAASTAITISANATYYASYQKSVTGTFYYSAGTTSDYIDTATQKSVTASATQYINYVGTKIESNFTVPTAVTSSVGSAIAKTYKGVATATNTATVVTPTTANTTFYAVYSEGLTFYYYNGTAHVSKAVTRRMLSNGTQYKGSLDQAEPVPSAYDGATFTSWQYQVSADSSVSRQPLTTGVSALYAKYTKSVSATFNYHNGTAAATATASANRYYVSNTSSGVTPFNNQITVPTAVKANRTISSVTYTYRGVSTSNSADATVLQANAITTANTTYYASYSYTVTLTFNGNGATSGTAPLNVSGTAYMQYNGTKKGVSLTMPTNPFARTGYTLDSTNPWNSNSAGNGTAYKASTAYTFTASATIYAKWNVNTYTVTIKSNNTAYGNVDKTSIANVPYNSTVTVSSNKITINGTTVTATPATKTAQYTYTFTRWSVSNGAKITGATTITATFSQTVNKYTVTFDANGGTTPNPATITKDYNAEIGTLPTTTKANYVFNGWYTAKTGETKISTTTKVTANVTYYAQWTSAQAKIGSTYFATLADAVTYANNNSTSSHTIELLVNALTISSTLNINSSITIKEVSGITNATIKRNVTTASFNMFNVSAGGSLAIRGNSKTDLITLDGQGGAGIYSLIANNGTLSVSYVKFYNNNAVSTSNTAKPNVRGGAIHGLDGSTTAIESCTFTNNKANYGGALLFEETATISGISSSEFTSNTAYKYGGAVYLAGGKDIKFTSCKFTSNTLGGASGQMGDAFYIQLTNVTFDSCEFTSNTNKSHTIHVESSSIDKDNRYIVKFNNTTVTGSQLVYVSNNLDFKQDHVLTISGGSFANIQVATTAKTYTPVYISASATISKITFGLASSLTNEASTKAIEFGSLSSYNSMSSTLISGATVPSGYKLVGDGSTAINCCKVYTITINANGGLGGTGSASPSSYTIKTTAQTVTLTPPSSTNYGFVNWTIETNSSGATSTISGNTLTIKAGAYGNIKVKANWSKIVVKNETTGKLYLENMGSGLLQKAINEASDDNSLNYYVDIAEDITITKAITLMSTSGNTLTSIITINAPDGQVIQFVSSDSAAKPMKIIGTVKNLSGNVRFVNINMISDTDPCISNKSADTIVIDSGTYQQQDKACNVIENLGGGDIQINGGTLFVGYDLTSGGDGGAVVVNANGNTYITGGTLHGYYGVYIGEYLDEDGNSYSGMVKVTIAGGTITGGSATGTAAVYMNGGWLDKLTIAGGTLNNDNAAEYDIYRNNGSITILKDVDFDIYFAQLQTTRTSSDFLKIDPSVTITKNHKIGFNSNGSNGIYYLYSSTSEATRNSMFNHVTLVDRYNLSKPNAAHSKYTKDTTYYGMLYLGNVVNETKFKVYSTLSSAIDDATRSTDDHGGDLINIVSSFTESAPIELSYCYTLFTSTGATFTGSLSLYRCSMQFGSDDGYPFYMNGNIQIDGDNSDQWMGMYGFNNAHITNSVNGGACITISASFANINLTDCELNATGDYTSSAILITKSVDTSGSPDIYINNSTITSTHGYAIKDEASSANYIKINSGTVSGTIDHVTINTEGGTIKGEIYLDKNHTLTINGGTIDALIYVEEIGNSSPITFNKDINFTRGIHLLANETSESKPLIKFNTSISKTFGILIFEDIPGGIIYAFSSTNKTYYDSVSNVVLYMDNTGETLSVTEITKTSTSGSTTTYTKVLYIGDVINLTQNTGHTSLVSAVNAATAGDTLMIMKALTYTSAVSISKNLTLVSYKSSAILTGKLSITSGTTTFGTSSYDYYGKNTITATGGSKLIFSDCDIASYDSNPTVIALNATVQVNGGIIYHSEGGIAMQLGDASNKATFGSRGGTIGSTTSKIGLYIRNATATVTGVRLTGGTQIIGSLVAITNYECINSATNQWSSANAVAGSSLTLSGVKTNAPYYSVLAKNMNIQLSPIYTMDMDGPIAYYTTSSSYKLTISETSASTNATYKIQLVGETNNLMTTVTPTYSQTTSPIKVANMTVGANIYKLIVNYNSTGWKFPYVGKTADLCKALLTNFGGAGTTIKNVVDNSTGNYMITQQGYYYEQSQHSGQFYVDTAAAKSTDGRHKFATLQEAFYSGFSDITILKSSAGDATFTGDSENGAQETITVRTASGITYNGKITVKEYGIVSLTNFTASSSNYYFVDSAGVLDIGSGTTISSSAIYTIMVNDATNAPDDQFINGNGELEVNSGATISNSYQTGVVIANKGYTTINGGTISSTSAGSYATGVMNYNNLKMNGGTIRVSYGATRKGVVNDSGVGRIKPTFTMTGGIIDMPSPNSTTYGIYNSASSGSTVTIGASTNSDNMPKIEPSFDDNVGYSIYNAETKTSSSQAYPITFTGYTYSMIIYLSTLNSTYAAINITNLKGVVRYGDDWDVIRLNANGSGYGYYNANATGVSGLMWVQAKYGGDVESLRTSTEGDNSFIYTDSVHWFASDSKNTYVHSGIDTCFDSNSWVYVWDEKKKKIRRKRAKNITYKDKLLVWNFDKGCFDFANPMFIQRDEKIEKYTEITFSDGTKLNIAKDHCVFNVDLGKFCPVVSDFVRNGCPIGTRVLKNDGTIVTVVKKKEIQKEISYTNIITKKHLNCYVNGILTSTAFNNMYQIKDMKYVKDGRHCENKSLLDGIDEEIIKDFRLEEIPDKVLMTSPLHVAGCKTMKDYIDDKLANMKPKD